MKIQGYSDIGNKRKENQDAFCIDDNCYEYISLTKELTIFSSPRSST